MTRRKSDTPWDQPKTKASERVKLMEQPTFRSQAGVLLVGTSALEAWKAQIARCNCGRLATAEAPVTGQCNDMPAQWIGCSGCSGQALGRPLVWRTESQIKACEAGVF
jgi:hypothetical protein